MRRRTKWIMLGALALPVASAVTLAAEIQHARSGPRLDDEEGSRPSELVIGDETMGDRVEIVWLGDSTTTGVGVDDFDDSMAHQVGRSVAAEVERTVELTVLGVSGARVDEVVAEQVPLLPATTDVVIVSVGANDVTHLTRRPTFRSEYQAMLDGIESNAPDAQVVIVGVPDMGGIPRFLQPLRAISGLRGRMLDEDVRNAATARGLRYVDLAGETGGIFRSDTERYFAGDQFHPSADGHAVWGEAVSDTAVEAAASVG